MKLLIVFVLSFNLCAAQKGFSYVLVGYENDDTTYEKIVGKEWVDFKDGSIPGWYYKVAYDYGEPPPHYFELVKSYLANGFPDTIRGWVVTDSLLFSIDGDCHFSTIELTQVCINKVNSFLPMYRERLSINIPGCTEDQEFSIKIYTPKEEMNRRNEVIKEKYNIK